MSKHPVRHDKTCQNCGQFVHDKFCAHCGQENTDVRHSFIYLIKHFIADLVHYDSSVWSTTRLLLFSPATLSKEYVGGRRKKYVDPVKLYIFISFITFFLPGILLEVSHEDKKSNISILTVDDTNFTIESTDRSTGKTTKDIIYTDAQLDSLANIKDISAIEYYSNKLMLKAQANSGRDRQDKMREFIMHNLPKSLFVYMPIFAFWLWLFHNKKKFLYFDSAIFTLHYFSFVLLSVSILLILDNIFEWVSINETIKTITYFVVFLYAIFYFFRANRLFYGEKRWISNIKTIIILSIDLVLIFVVFILFALLALYMI